MQRLIFKFLITLLFSVSISAHAIPVLLKQGNIYYGATGIEVNNEIYDVRFLDGYFSDIFSASDWNPFQSEADIWLANNLLHTMIMAEKPLNLDPSLTSGCTLNECYILSPMASRADDGTHIFGVINPLHSFIRSAVSINGEGINPDVDYESLGDSYKFVDLSEWEGFVWARWTLSSTQVTEPSGIFIMLIGSILLFSRRFLCR